MRREATASLELRLRQISALSIAVEFQGIAEKLSESGFPVLVPTSIQQKITE